MREKRKFILSVELLFLAGFALWAFVRAANPAIIGTEKPMEMAFINAILRSPAFRPMTPGFLVTPFLIITLAMYWRLCSSE